MTTPIRTLGIVGGNLLAAMLCLEAQKRGIQTILLEPELNNIAAEMADSHMMSTIEEQAIERLALRTDAVVFCTSDIPPLSQELQGAHRFYPSDEGINLVSNRIEQLVGATMCEVPVPKFYHQHNKVAFLKQAEEASMPFRVYQIYNDGYDAFEINEDEDMRSFIKEMDEEAIEWLIEEVSSYEKILSITALVAPQKTFVYPVQEEILGEREVKYVQLPAAITKNMEQKIGRYTRKLLQERETEGLFTLKFGVKKNRSLELISINPGINVGDIATNHFADLSVYEQFFNLIERKLMKDGELMMPCTVTVAKENDTTHVPQFPYHSYVFDRQNALPVSIYVKAQQKEEKA